METCGTTAGEGRWVPQYLVIRKAPSEWSAGVKAWHQAGVAGPCGGPRSGWGESVLGTGMMAGLLAGTDGGSEEVAPVEPL